MRGIGWLLVGALMLGGMARAEQVSAHDPLGEAARQMAERFAELAKPRKGLVGAVNPAATPTEIYVTLGTAQGVVPGQMLSIQEPGEAIVIGGQTVGYTETPVGTAEIVRVQGEQLCVAKMVTTFPGRTPAKENAAYITTVPSRLVVLPFVRSDGQAMQLGRDYARKVEGALSQAGSFTTIERERFEALMAELKLGISDLYDPTKTARLGQQLQAQAVVIGTMTLRDVWCEIQARVVDIASGVQVAYASATAPGSVEIVNRYAADGAAATPRSEPKLTEGRPGSSQPPASETPVPEENNDDALEVFRLPVSVFLVNGGRQEQEAQDWAEKGRVEDCLMAGRLWRKCYVLANRFGPESRLAYTTLTRPYRWLEGVIGSVDGRSGHGPYGARLAIRADGKIVSQARIPDSGQPPAYLQCDITGCETLGVEIREYRSEAFSLATHNLRIHNGKPGPMPVGAVKAEEVQ